MDVRLAAAQPISAGERAEVIQLAFLPLPLEAAHCLSRLALLIDCNVAKGITPPLKGQLCQHYVLDFLQLNASHGQSLIKELTMLLHELNYSFLHFVLPGCRTDSALGNSAFLLLCSP